MFSFEGDFRTKPKVSLGGASKQEEKSSLLSRTLDERRKREDERRRQRNAVVIQSFVRGCITRCKQHNAQRCIFDEFATRLELAGDVATYSHIAGKLLFFYNESLDTSRLVYVCQGLLRHHTAFLQLLAGPNSLQVLYRLQRLLLLCCRLFRVESEVLAVPLRMVEVFISLESYKAALSCCPPPCVVPQKPPSVAGTASSPLRATVALENVLFYLVRNEYFHYHCCLLNQRLPPHLEYPAPHTVPLASLLVNNLLEPLQLQYTSCGPRSRQRVLCHFIREVLCVPYTEQMHSFLLPALSDRANAFPYTPLLEALHNAGDHDGQCMGMSRATDDAKQMANLRRAGQEGSGFGIPWLELWGSPWLLHAMLTLGERHLGSLLEPHVLLYLRVLQSLLHRLPSSTRAQHTGSGVGDSEDEDDDEQESRMSSDKAGPEGRPWEHVVREECLHMLDSREQTSTLLAAVWSPSAGEQVLTVMASICHQLMVDHRVMVPRTRLLYSLAFHPRFLRHLWHLITTLSTTMITGSQVPLLQLLSRGAPLQPCDSSRIVPVFYLFCSLFGHFLISVHDNEFFGDEQSGCNMTPYTNCTKSSMPFSLAELVEMSLRLRDACLGIIQLAYPDSRPELRDSYAQALQGSSVRRAVAQPAEQRLQEQRTRYTHLFKVISNLVKMLKARDARRHFCPRNHWLSQQVTICADRVPQLYMPGTRHVWRSHRLHNIGPLWSTLDVGQDCPPLSVPEERQLAILTELPFVVPFAERVKIFQRLIMVEKEESQGESSFFGGINVVIRRNYIYEDAFDKLSPENDSWKSENRKEVNKIESGKHQQQSGGESENKGRREGHIGRSNETVIDEAGYMSGIPAKNMSNQNSLPVGKVFRHLGQYLVETPLAEMTAMSLFGPLPALFSKMVKSLSILHVRRPLPALYSEMVKSLPILHVRRPLPALYSEMVKSLPILHVGGPLPALHSKMVKSLSILHVRRPLPALYSEMVKSLSILHVRRPLPPLYSEMVKSLPILHVCRPLPPLYSEMVKSLPILHVCRPLPALHSEMVKSLSILHACRPLPALFSKMVKSLSILHVRRPLPALYSEMVKSLPILHVRRPLPALYSEMVKSLSILHVRRPLPALFSEMVKSLSILHVRRPLPALYSEMVKSLSILHVRRPLPALFSEMVKSLSILHMCRPLPALYSEMMKSLSILHVCRPLPALYSEIVKSLSILHVRRPPPALYSEMVKSLSILHVCRPLPALYSEMMKSLSILHVWRPLPALYSEMVKSLSILHMCRPLPALYSEMVKSLSILHMRRPLPALYSEMVKSLPNLHVRRPLPALYSEMVKCLPILHVLGLYQLCTASTSFVQRDGEVFAHSSRVSASPIFAQRDGEIFAQCGYISVLRIVVSMKCESSQFLIHDSLKQVIIKDSPVPCTIHCPFSPHKLASLC
uniref:ubiquitin-protein ligase E3C-like n=1 Tax=Myxine glutinosa TaxID=7769 RepID=UPI00358E6C06